jgi:2-keto-4-pentenoate hydratase
MSTMLDDPRIANGMRAQFELRARRLAAGEQPIGWKVGFGTPAGMQRLNITAPLTGFLTDKSLLASGAEFSLQGMTKPVIEPEIAIYLGNDVPGGADRQTAAAAVAALGPAIEIADLDAPVDDPEPILAGNIFHRRIIVGPRDSAYAGARLAGLSSDVTRHHTKVPPPASLEVNTGELIGIVQHVADVVAACGDTLRAGQFIIAGSIVPPILLEPGEDFVSYTLDPIGTLTVRFTR